MSAPFDFQDRVVMAGCALVMVCWLLIGWLS